jgi:polyisoprenyl-teichoic acid--peptidoglycan teichoic acid transferase
MPKKRRGSWLGKVTWGVSFAMIGMVSAGVGAALTMTTPFLADHSQQHPQRDPNSLGELLQRGLEHGVGRPVNILVMGIDRVPPDSPEAAKGIFAGRSDTMLLVRVNPEQGNANVLTIPRDTLVEIPNYGSDKINSANVFGGPMLAAEVVSRTLDYTPVDPYVRVSTTAFRDLVDLVGGVEVYVPKPMQYTDQTQKLFIDLKPGLQVLNGVQAEGFARYRHDELGDIGRAQRQQTVLKALQRRLASPMTIARLPQLYSILQKNVDSDLSLGETLALVQFAIQLKPDQLKMVLLPGRFSAAGEFNASYWLMDEAAMQSVVRSNFQPEQSLPNTTGNPTSLDPKALKIAIQNASSNPAASRELADYLASQGYYNTFIDADWVRQEPRTEVIAQRGDVKGAKILQGVVGVGDILPDSSGNIDSDITIRIGEDWASRRASR